MHARFRPRGLRTPGFAKRRGFASDLRRSGRNGRRFGCASSGTGTWTGRRAVRADGRNGYRSEGGGRMRSSRPVAAVAPAAHAVRLWSGAGLDARESDNRHLPRRAWRSPRSFLGPKPQAVDLLPRFGAICGFGKSRSGGQDRK